MKAAAVAVLLGVCWAASAVPLDRIDAQAAASRAQDAATNPAEPVVVGVERVIAKTLLKLNRTLSFKAKDDKVFDGQIANVTASLEKNQDKVAAAEKCIDAEKDKAAVAEKAILKLTKQKKGLQESVQVLKKAMEMRDLAKGKMVDKVSSWRGHIDEDSKKRLAALQKSSDVLLGVVKANKIHVDSPPLAPPASPPTKEIPTGGVQNVPGMTNPVQHSVTTTLKVDVSRSADGGVKVDTAPVLLDIDEVVRRLRADPDPAAKEAKGGDAGVDAAPADDGAKEKKKAKCDKTACDQCPTGWSLEDDGSCCGKCIDPEAGLDGPKKCPSKDSKLGAIQDTDCAWPEDKPCSFGALKCCDKEEAEFKCECIDGRTMCQYTDGCSDPKCDEEAKGKAEEAEKPAEEKGGEEKGSGIAFDSVQLDIIGMLKQYGGVHDKLSGLLKDKLRKASSSIPAAQTKTDNAVHEVVIEELSQTQLKLDAAKEAERGVIEAAEAAVLRCRDDKSEAEPMVEAGLARLEAIKKKKDASDKYYAKHVTGFKETITFAQKTLTEMEARATKEFASEERSAKLQKMRQEIERILDLCTKLVPSKEKKEDEGEEEEEEAEPKKMGGMKAVTHVEHNTVAAAAAHSTTHMVSAMVPMGL